jgi:hypothetical protein
MESNRKYSPSLLHVLAAGRFCLEEQMEGKMAAAGDIPKSEFRIFIRNSENKGRCYLIAYEQDGRAQIWEGSCTGDIWHKMPESGLFENKDKLGEVIVKRNHLRVKEYQTYDQFWDDIRRY